MDDSIASVNNVIDLRGGSLTEDYMETATNIIVENYGVPTDQYLAPRALSDMAKNFYPRERIALPAPEQGRVGMAVTEVLTQAGLVKLQGDIFLRSGTNNGKKTAPTSQTAQRAPNAPTIAASAASNAASQFGSSDAATYQYKVTSINRFGESAPAQLSGGQAVTAGQGVTAVITDGGGSDGATGYRLYRTSINNNVLGQEMMIAEIARVGQSATTTYVDNNQYLPGTSRAYLLQMNMQSLSFKQLAPMMKIPLATLAASIRWMQLLYGVPTVYAPRKNVIFINVNDD